MWKYIVEVPHLNNPCYTNCKVGYSENRGGMLGTKGNFAHRTDATILCLNGCFMPQGGMLGTNPIDITFIVRPKADITHEWEAGGLNLANIARTYAE